MNVPPNTQAYRICQLLFATHPMGAREIMQALPEFTTMKKLTNALERGKQGSGISVQFGKIKLTQSAIDHFSGTKPRAVVQQKMKPLNLSRLPTLSPNRHDVPEWSLREAHFYTSGQSTSSYRGL